MRAKYIYAEDRRTGWAGVVCGAGFAAVLQRVLNVLGMPRAASVAQMETAPCFCRLMMILLATESHESETTHLVSLDVE